jgi:hypothetical protein
MQSIFLKETQGKEASTCPRGGQQVAENGGNERAVPICSGIPDGVQRRRSTLGEESAANNHHESLWTSIPVSRQLSMCLGWF